MNAVNLIPSDQRRGAAGSLGVYAVLGALALALVAVTALVLTSNEVSTKQSQLAAATQRREVLTRQVSALQPYVSFNTLEQTRAETVRTLAASRFRWDRAMRGLARVTTPQVWLTTMLGTVAPGVEAATSSGGSGASSASSASSAAAGGGGHLRDALPNPAIELTGCGASNRAVVAYTSRLRALEGVVRVSLTDTQKPDQVPSSESDSASTPSQAPEGAAQDCGSSPDVATFHAVVFFAPLPTPTAAATATGTPSPTTAATAGATP
jgi:Tfp pilus assembly protein PilN